jgi:hypothetical protein
VSAKRGAARTGETQAACRHRTALEYPAPKNSQVTIRHAWPPNWERPASGAWVLIQPWEFGVLPEEWTIAPAVSMRSGSIRLRSSSVLTQVSTRQGQDCSLGIDPEKFKPGLQPLKLATAKSFNSFRRRTIHRKGPDPLLKAYFENFTAADDVCLVIKISAAKAYTGQTSSRRFALRKRSRTHPRFSTSTRPAPEALPVSTPRAIVSCTVSRRRLRLASA